MLQDGVVNPPPVLPPPLLEVDDAAEAVEVAVEPAPVKLREEAPPPLPPPAHACWYCDDVRPEACRTHVKQVLLSSPSALHSHVVSVSEHCSPALSAVWSEELLHWVLQVLPLAPVGELPAALLVPEPLLEELPLQASL